MIVQVTLHEWRRQHAGLTFWLLLAFTQLIVAWLSFAQLEAFAEIAPQLRAGAATIGATDLVIMPTFNSLLLLLLLTSPLLAMGSLAGEVHSGRMALWLAAPVSSAQIVIGKVLGLWLAILPLVLSASLTLAALGLGVELDTARFGLGVAAMLTVALWLACITVFVSGLFDHPAAALATSYGVLLFLWLLDSLSGPSAPWHGWALLPHVEPMLLGLLRSQDLLYFISTGGAAVLLGIFLVDRRRGAI
jgi:ABC-2 type transport system permease protein